MNAPVLELFSFAMPRNAWVRVARDLRASAGDAAALKFCREAARLREGCGDLSEARNVYHYILRDLAPGHPPTIRRLSDLERRMHATSLRAEGPRARRAGNHERALQIYMQLVAIEPGDGFHPLRAGECLVRTGRADEAIDCYREAALRFAASGKERRARAVTRILERLASAAPRGTGTAAAGASGRIALAERRAAL